MQYVDCRMNKLWCVLQKLEAHITLWYYCSVFLVSLLKCDLCFRYIDLKESSLFDMNTSLPVFFSSLPKTRRQTDVVQELTKMIGRNIRLYDMVLQFLRTLFMRTRNVHYCTLRAELLMAVHDADIQEITSADPCHKFTWCLDACIRDKLIDTKRMRELHGFLDSMTGYHQQQVLGWVRCQLDS